MRTFVLFATLALFVAMMPAAAVAGDSCGHKAAYGSTCGHDWSPCDGCRAAGKDGCDKCRGGDGHTHFWKNGSWKGGHWGHGSHGCPPWPGGCCDSDYSVSQQTVKRAYLHPVCGGGFPHAGYDGDACGWECGDYGRWLWD